MKDKLPTTRIEKGTNEPKQPVNVAESLAVDLEGMFRVPEFLKDFIGENPSDSVTSSDSAGSTSTSTSKVAKKSDDTVRILKASKPTPATMVADIHKLISKELRTLNREKNVYYKMGQKALHKFNESISRIRQLRRLLASLAYASYDQLKAIWLKVVHGIV